MDGDALLPETLGAAEIGQVDDESGASNGRARAADQPYRREGRAASRDQIVDEMHPPLVKAVRAEAT